LQLNPQVGGVPVQVALALAGAAGQGAQALPQVLTLVFRAQVAPQR
jgi:hypothetical protein